MLLKDRLYVRDYNETDVPFKLYDKNTLEVIETDDNKCRLLKCKRNLDTDLGTLQNLNLLKAAI